LGINKLRVEPVDARVASLMGAVQPLTEAFRPVFRVLEGGGREVLGTAIVVADGSTRFVLTANHVFDPPGARFIGVRDSLSIPWPGKRSRLQATRADLPDADVTWVRGTTIDEDRQFQASIPAALAIAALDDSPRGVYIAAGYPTSRAKVRMGEGLISAKLMLAAVELAPEVKRDAVAAHTDAQMVFRYSQTGRTNASGQPAMGAHPRGMSGGGVFLVTRGDDEENPPQLIPFLVGVLTEFHEKEDVLVATRIRRIWEATGMQRPVGERLYRRVDA
jgi:hypothetical protein